MSDDLKKPLTPNEVVNLTSDSVIGAGGFTVGELMQNLSCNANDGHPREQRACRRCQQLWTPGDWNFYNLCNTCFALFDQQKMAGRMAMLFGGNKPSYYSESCEQWITDFPTRVEDE